MKLKRKIMLFEDFETAQVTQTKVAKSVNTDSVATKVKSSDNIRTEVIADVDVILTNLEQLSAQILELNSVNEAQEDWMTKLLDSIKSSISYAKLEAGFPTLEKLAQAANDNFISADTQKAVGPAVDAKGKLMLAKEKAKGEAKLAVQSKIDKIDAGIEKIKSSVELKKQAAVNALDTFKEKIKKDEEVLKGVLKELYDAKKLKVTRAVQEQGLLIKAKLAQQAGRKEAAIKAQQEANEIAAEQKELDKRISDGTLEATDDLESIKGIKPFLAEVTAMRDTKLAADKVRKEIETAGAAYEAAQYSAFINDIMISEDIATLFSNNKGDDADEETKVGSLKQTKEFADALAKAAAEEWAAKKALYDKAKGQEVTKQIVQLAGGDVDAAEETEKGFKIGTLVPKWGDGTTFITVDEYGDVKKSKEVLDQIDDAIAQAQSGGGSGETEKSAEEVAKDELGDEFNNYSKITDPEEEVEVTDDEGNTTTKKKWTDIKKFKGKDAEGADTDKEVIYAKEVKESIRTPNKPKLYEGMSIADRFKILM